MKRYLIVLSLLAFMSVSPSLWANEVRIPGVQFNYTGSSWTVNTTLQHADTGWDHYADAWRVVDASGKVLGTRTLYHPHENEQPFTRSLSGMNIPAGVNIVYVEAHDKVHGWSKDRLKVDLSKRSGKRFEVRR